LPVLLLVDRIGQSMHRTTNPSAEEGQHSMIKKAFTTRIDTDVLDIAQRLADEERRSVTSVIEVAVIAYHRQKAMITELEAAAS
jgi:hypothetical protein